MTIKLRGNEGRVETPSGFTSRFTSRHKQRVSASLASVDNPITGLGLEYISEMKDYVQPDASPDGQRRGGAVGSRKQMRDVNAQLIVVLHTSLSFLPLE